jgi:hypothetical protein
MPTLQIGRDVVQIGNVDTVGISAQNVGDVDLYLSEIPDVSGLENATQLLSPGEYLNWPPGRQLYVTVGSTANPLDIGYLLYSTNGALKSAGPAPSTVFAKSASNVVLLHSESIPFLAAAASGGGALFTLDVSTYASVIVSIDITAGLNANLASYLYPSFSFSDTNTIITNPRANTHYAPQWLLCSTEQTIYGLRQPQSLQMPVTGKYLLGLIEYLKIVTAVGGTIRVDVYGSGDSITTPKYVSRGQGMGIGLVDWRMYAISQGPSLSNLYYIASNNGHTKVFSANPGGAAAGRYNMFNVLSGALSGVTGTRPPATAGIGVIDDTILGLLPAALSIVTVAGENLALTITQ